MATAGGGVRPIAGARGRWCRSQPPCARVGHSASSRPKYCRTSVRPACVFRNRSKRSAAGSLANCRTVVRRQGRWAAVSGECPALCVAKRAATCVAASTNCRVGSCRLCRTKTNRLTSALTRDAAARSRPCPNAHDLPCRSRKLARAVSLSSSRRSSSSARFLHTIETGGTLRAARGPTRRRVCHRATRLDTGCRRA